MLFSFSISIVMVLLVSQRSVKMKSNPGVNSAKA
jgi:hypothetical protein